MKDSFLYARAADEPEKGGRVVTSNCVYSDVPIDVQLALMMGMTYSEYEVEAYTIIISHSKEDTKKIRELSKDDPDYAELYLDAFLDELQKSGIDLANTPYVVTEHTNTDCLHYHMVISSAKFDNSRLDSGFIGKKAAMAAAAVSRKYGLKYATSLDERAKIFNKKKEQGQSNFNPPFKRKKRRTQEEMEEDAAKKKKRKLAIERAKERKALLRLFVESAFENAKNKSEFISLLAEKNIGLSSYEGKGWRVLWTDEEGKTRAYSFANLSIDQGKAAEMESMLEKKEKEFGPSFVPTYTAEEARTTVQDIKDVFANSGNWLGELLGSGGAEPTGGIGGGGTKDLSRKKRKKDDEDKEGRGHGY